MEGKKKSREEKGIRLRLLGVIALVLVVGVFLAGCVGMNKEKKDELQKRGEVVVTFNPYKLMMNDLGIESILLIPSNSDPHTYTPHIADMEKVKEASLVVGDGFIDKKILENIAREKVYVAGYAPHIWLDINVFIKLGERMKREGYEVNESALEEGKSLLDKYKGKIKLKVIALHKLLNKPLSVYGIKVVDELLTHEHEELSLNDIERIRKEDADVILVTNKEQKKMLEGKVNKKIFVLDIMEINRGEESYLEVMRKNLEGLYEEYKKK